MTPNIALSRRLILKPASIGFGGLALTDILQAASGSQTARGPGFVQKAKRVIFLFMAGGPSQHDPFDPKEFIREKHGQKIDSPLRKEEIQIGTEQYMALAEAAAVTDHMGYNVIDGKVQIHDLHAKMLHLLGIDHTKLTWNKAGRDFRLADVHGSVVKEILA